jgi:DNA-binding response OmpR family regulator
LTGGHGTAGARVSRIIDGKKPLVLIAETLPEHLQLLSNAFKQAGFEVRTASSCRECLDIFTSIRDQVDLVLLNGTIPGEKGIDLLIKIRRIKQDQRILVVVTEFNTRAYAMELGAEVFLSKPLDPQAVLQRASTLLRQDDSFKIRRHQRIAQLQAV